MKNKKRLWAFFSNLRIEFEEALFESLFFQNLFLSFKPFSIKFYLHNIKSAILESKICIFKKLFVLFIYINN